MDFVWYPPAKTAKTGFAVKLRTRAGGFIMIVLIPFTMICVTGLSGLSFLSLGIRNLTRSQSICIRESFQGQKKLRRLLELLLEMNPTVIRLNTIKTALQKSLKIAIQTGQLYLVPPLKAKIAIIKKRQKLLFLQQERILMQSEIQKKAVFTNLQSRMKFREIKNLTDETAFNRALAVSKKTLGPFARTYSPLPDFTRRQAVVFSWDIHPFFQFNKTFMAFPPLRESPYVKRSCSATLEKQRGAWRVRLIRRPGR